MNHTWKKTITTAVLSAALLTVVAAPAWAANPAPAAGASVVRYALTDSMDVELKSLFNDRTGDTSRLGAVVRMRNTAGKLQRVPDVELRVLTADGVSYTLQPSSRNVRAIQPKAVQELSYLATVDRMDEVDVTELNWVDVDTDVYPKRETVLLKLAVGPDQVWNGANSVVTNVTAIRKWGEAFTLDALRSPVVLRPVDLHQEVTAKGVATVVQLEASNPTKERQLVPAFGLDGQADGKVYTGSRAEASVSLEAGEKKYVHVVMPTELDTALTSLTVVTPETFSGQGGDETFRIGRLSILLPDAAGEADLASLAPLYKLGDPLKLDSVSKLIPSSMDVSLVELHMSANVEDGFNTAVAKFKLTNKGDRSVPVPPFAAELRSKDGYIYSGSRQQATAASIVPGASYVVSYAFALPASETGEGLQLGIYSKQSAGDYSYKSLLGVCRVELQAADPADQLVLYPYTAKVTSWDISANMSQQTFTYNYRLKLFLNLKQDKAVLTDANGSKLQFDLYNSTGSLIGSATQSFYGQNRLLNGENDVIIGSATSQLEVPLTVKVYEVFTTDNNEQAKRLLTTFKQF
ncbi:hypothetical protein B5M42_022925 [Paenibacillus athensensis]|uniref:DUF4139 domain-containing protein n=1 Tax=Paenibacillus athensensis TaxID=1967502 RepID=A0A4Y8PT36_9BACL|nr:hypothetical protein [Paenibacillus athensensis]MCD1261662.1 hypothetical protein [Paenibacillus athensensis]